MVVAISPARPNSSSHLALEPAMPTECRCHRPESEKLAGTRPKTLPAAPMFDAIGAVKPGLAVAYWLNWGARMYPLYNTCGKIEVDPDG